MEKIQSDSIPTTIYKLDPREYTHLVVCNVQGRDLPVGLFTNGMDARLFIKGIPEGNYRIITNFVMGDS